MWPTPLLRAFLCLAHVLLVTSWLGCSAPTGPDCWLRADTCTGRVAGELVASPNPADSVTIEAGTGSAEPLVVHLRSLSSENRSRDRHPVELAIAEGRLRPELPVIAPDAAVRLTNEDRVHHELFTAGAEDGLDLRLAPGQQATVPSIGDAGLLRAYCRLHPQERFLAVVREADRIARVRGDVGFAFEALPPALYEVRAAGLHGETAPIRVNVTKGETARVSLSLAVERDDRVRVR